MARHSTNRKQPPGQRQLRVGEEIRHALSEVFMRGELHVPELDSASVTVSEVRISPDLKNATAYVMPLAGHNTEEVLDVLQEHAPVISRLVGGKIHLKFTPRLRFRLDDTFETASRIHSLLQNPKVQQDVASKDDDDRED